MIGQHRENIEILKKIGYNCKVYADTVEDYKVVCLKDV